MTDRELISKCLWLFSPKDERGVLVLQLCELVERLLAANRRTASDEDGIRREIDDGPTVALLVWADVLCEKGEDAVGDTMRHLARLGKWPGKSQGVYWWSQDRDFGVGPATFSLPKDVHAALNRFNSTKCKFPSASEAMLCAARAWAFVEAQKQPPPKGHVDCPMCGVVKVMLKKTKTLLLTCCGKCERTLLFADLPE